MVSIVVIAAAAGGVAAGLLLFILICCCCRRRSKKSEKDRRKFGHAQRQRRVQLGPPPSTQLRTERVTEEENIHHGHVGDRSTSLTSTTIEYQQGDDKHRRSRQSLDIEDASEVRSRTLEKKLRPTSGVSVSSSGSLPLMASLTDRRGSEYNPLDALANFDEDDQVDGAEMSVLMSLRQQAGAVSDDTDADAGLGKVQFRLEYCYDRNSIRLHLIRAENLPGKDMSGTSDPFLKVYLVDMRQMSPDGRVKLGKAWRTRTYPQNLNPVIDEYHDFECSTIAATRHLGLLMHIYDYDRFTRNDIIGHIWFPMKGVDLSDIPTFWKAIQPGRNIKADEAQMDLGELQLALGYQRSLRQLMLVVRHARSLPKMDDAGSADPFVKVQLTYRGQKLAKQQTETKSRTLNPIFNNSLTFKLGKSTDIKDARLICKVVHRDSVVNNKPIGTVVLGLQGSTETAARHWQMMLDSDRSIETSIWHTIQPRRAAKQPKTGSAKSHST